MFYAHYEAILLIISLPLPIKKQNCQEWKKLVLETTGKWYGLLSNLGPGLLFNPAIAWSANNSMIPFHDVQDELLD